MTQFVNNFLINFNITNILYILASFIEIYLFLKLLLIIFDVKSTVKQKLIFIVVVVPMSKILSYFIPSPFNVILNYTFIAFLITAIFKLSILKSFTSLIISLFIFGVLNVLLQNPYLTLLDISPEEFLNVPVYRLPYLIILYLALTLIIIFLTKFRKIKFSLDLLDTLDKKTVIVLCLNLILVF